MIELDRESLLVHASGSERLADVEAWLAQENLTLDVTPMSPMTIAAWLESGAEGARSAWLDPSDHLVAGFTARVRSSSETFTIRPVPRRAVGPDLLSLVLGVRGRFLALDAVWLRVHRKDVKRPVAKFDASPEPLTPGEEALFDLVESALF